MASSRVPRGRRKLWIIRFGPTWYPFTWDRGHGTTKWLEIRLDRALISNSWSRETFQDAKLTNLEVSTFDHCPILLEPTIVQHTPRMRKFMFENA